MCMHVVHVSGHSLYVLPLYLDFVCHAVFPLQYSWSRWSTLSHNFINVTLWHSFKRAVHWLTVRCPDNYILEQYTTVHYSKLYSTLYSSPVWASVCYSELHHDVHYSNSAENSTVQSTLQYTLQCTTVLYSLGICMLEWTTVRAAVGPIWKLSPSIKQGRLKMLTVENMKDLRSDHQSRMLKSMQTSLKKKQILNWDLFSFLQTLHL